MRISLPSLSKKTLEKPARAAKRQKPSGGSRFALMLGDEGAILVLLEDGKVQGRYFAPSCTPEHVADFNSILAAHAKLPIVVILDTLDQTYIQQSLPPVSSVSTNKLVKRRLVKEFASVPLKGSVMLGRDKENKEWNFLLVGVDQTPAVKAWLEWVATLPNHCKGIELLPLECEYALKRLQQSQPNQQPYPWHFLISHNKVSGFRQVVLKEGKTVFTRLGQPLSDDDQAVAAGVIEQETQTVLEYLKRMALKDANQIHLDIVAAQDIINAIDRQKLRVGSVGLHTPHALAVQYGLEDIAQPQDRFGDVVLATVISTPHKSKLTLWTPLLKKFEQFCRVHMAVRAMAALAVLWAFFSLGSSIYTYFSSNYEISDLQTNLQNKKAAYEQLRKEAATIVSDIDKMVDTISVYDLLMQEAYTPVPFFTLLSEALKDEGRITKIEWKIVKPSTDGNASSGTANTPTDIAGYPLGKASVEGVINLTFLNFSRNQEARRDESEALLRKLNNFFPGYEFSYEFMQGILRESERLEINDALIQAKEVAVPTAVLKFKGPIILRRMQNMGEQQ